MSREWVARAACVGYDPELWFTVESPHRGSMAAIAEAQLVCARCEVSSECLAEALRDRVVDGIWGGLLPSERAYLTRRRGKSW